MFGNLKNKISSTSDLKKFSSPQVLNSLSSSRQRSNHQTPGSHTPSFSHHSRQASDTSQTTLSHVSDLSIKEDDATVKTLKHEELEKEICKQKAELDSQKDKISNLSIRESELLSRLHDEHNKTVQLEKELKDTRERESNLVKLIGHKEIEASKKLELANETIGSEEKLIILQENYDELEGLGAQEVAKLKHMLLNTTADLEKEKTRYEEKTQMISDLEGRLRTYEGLEGRLQNFNEEKMDLETKMAGLGHKLNAANAKLASQSEQYQTEISHLKEKLEVLQRRRSQSSMGDEEKNEDIQKERVMLERKLEEARQQLLDIKSSWSDKISSLESQIEHLNRKIVEDQMDLKKAVEENEELNYKVCEMENTRKQTEEKHKLEIVRLEKQIFTLTEDLDIVNQQYKLELEKKESQIGEVNSMLESSKEELSQSLQELLSEKEQRCLIENGLKESEKKLRELEHSKKELEAKCSNLEKLTVSLQERGVQESSLIREFESEISSLKEKYDIISSEKSKLSTNLDRYSEKVAELEMVIGSLESEKSTLTAKVSELQKTVLDLESKEESCNSANLEKEIENRIEGSDLVQELKRRLKESEDELNEKKQMLKVQSNRLADMKKTFQKELKINPEISDFIPETNGESQTHQAHLQPHMPVSPNLQRSPVPMNSRISKRVQNNADLQVGDVNLEYLKHVILKFVTSREYEALQLTRAVSTLLHLTEDEENLLRETLEWKMSWFRSRPSVGKGNLEK